MEPEEGTTKTRDDSGYASAGADQAEAFANDPANSSRDFAGEAASNSKSRLSSGISAIKQGISNNPGKAKLAGGGAGLAALIMAAFIALLPLKLEAIMKNIFQHRVGDKIEHMEEKRADKMVIRYLTNASTSDGVYADGTILTSLYRNWRLKKFETKFTQKSGIKIEKLNGGGVRITTPDGKVVPGTKNEAELQKFFSGGSDTADLKGLDARKFFREVTRSNTRWLQVYKRVTMRNFMRNAYGIRKWSWFTGKENTEGSANVTEEISKASMDPYGEETPKVIGCALQGSECPSDELGREKPYGPDPAPHPKPDSSTNGKGDSDLSSGVADAVDEAGKEVAKESAKHSDTIVSKALTKALTPLIGEKLTTTFTSKFIPIVGQILLVDMLARIDHFFTSGAADTALRSVHKVQYATEFAAFLSIDDNSKDPNKKMSGSEFNTVMTKLGNPSGSAGFNEIFLGKTGGKGLDPSLGIDDRGKSNPIKDNYTTNAAIATGGSVYILRTWYTVIDQTYAHYIIDIVNKVLESLVKIAINIANAATGGAIDSATSFVGKYLGKMMMFLITPAVDGSEKDGDLFSAIDAGGAVVGQDYCKTLGCHKLSTAQTSNLQRAIAFDKSQSQPNLWARLFSPEYNGSVVNQLAAISPASTGQATSQITSYSVAVMKNPLSVFDGLLNSIINKAHADTPQNIYGLQDYGYTEAELDQPLQLPKDYNGDGKINTDDCHYTDDGYNPDGTPRGKKIDDSEFNNLSTGRLCLLDETTAENLGATSSDAPSAGNSSTTASTPSGSVANGNEQQLAQQILANPNISFDYGPTGRIAQPFIDLAAGNKASTLDAAPATDVSTKILQAILLAAQTHKINVSSLTTGHSVGDVHSTGRAVDFNIIDGVHSTGRDTNTVAVINLLAGFLPQGSGFGQTADPHTHIPCGPAITLPAGINQFEDTCDHIHIQVPSL